MWVTSLNVIEVINKLTYSKYKAWVWFFLRFNDNRL